MTRTNTSGLEALGRAVLVRPYAVEAASAGGIILPDQVRKKDQLAEQRAVVVHVGTEAWRDEKTPRAWPGDKIMFSKWAGYVALGPQDGQEYRVINDSDVFLAITCEEGGAT